MIFYVIVFCLSIYRLPEYKNTPAKFLPIIFLITIFTEYHGGYLMSKGSFDNTYHNIYFLLFFLLFYFIYHNTLEKKIFKLIIKCSAILLFIPFIWEINTVDIVRGTFGITYIVGAILLVTCIIFYFISILQSSRVLVIKNDLLFWISVGLFLFYIGYIPIKLMRSQYFETTDIEFIYTLLIIQGSLIIVMYVCFIIGFLWMKRR